MLNKQVMRDKYDDCVCMCVRVYRVMQKWRFVKAMIEMNG
jgi:hypothetical protein